MKPVIERIANITEEMLHIRVIEGVYKPCKQTPYKQETGDRIETDAKGITYLYRNNEKVGVLVDHRRTVTWFDDIIGEKFMENDAENVDNYNIHSQSDEEYYKGKRPEKVFIKTKPFSFCMDSGKRQFQYDLYLKLPFKMKEGCAYKVVVENLNLRDAECEYRYDPVHTRSEAVHVNQIGYHPEDLVKRAYLSIWLGTGGSFAFETTRRFHIIDCVTNESVYTGQIEISKSADEAENFWVKKNHNYTHVYKMDFSDFQKIGLFKIYVEDVGCSYSFPIEEKIWEDAFKTSMKGLYHNRSGIELGPPYTDYVRPRPYHQDDGLIVFHSEVPIMDTGNGLNALGTDRNNFGNLVAARTNMVVANAWGGYFDAADWDRRIQHLSASRLHLELMELNSEYFSKQNLNIPESGNSLPDVINEALWNIDCYKRLQTEDGGVRGGIEAEEHPKKGETSWQESMTVMTYAPGIWSSYEYASLAARAAYFLKDYDAELADDYRDSALKAACWAEERYPDWNRREDVRDSAKERVLASRNLAAVELYRLTWSEKWHDIFLRTVKEQRDALFVYALLPENKVVPEIRDRAYRLFAEDGDKAVVSGEGNAFNVTSPDIDRRIGPWGHFFSMPNVVSVVRAHYLTQNPKYLKAILQACHFGAGANPLNLCYTTGLGQNYPVDFMHIDSRRRGMKAPEGITIYGNYDMLAVPEHWFSKSLLNDVTHIKPGLRNWPVTEMYFDIYSDAASNEWTIQQTLGPNSYVWGYLAAYTSNK